ncbi:hypothetical protein PIB30_069376 [Stylosanthes scabra]|uniref:Transposase, Ptta/En/Spm, plant n=1 Tax=Stylosanthes scabra TaxID=79078 RepID=A0ABU6VN58_9FABA|nr:hypothetical protein [Stylosanthes scabra]
MPWPPVDNPLPEGEEVDIAMEEELSRQAGRVWNKVRKGTTKISWVFQNYYRWFVPQFSLAPDHAVHFLWDRWRSFFGLQQGYEFKIYESWRMRPSKRLRELMHEIRNKGAPHGWIRDDLWDRLVEFWRQEDFKKLKQVNKRNRASSTSGSLQTGGSTTYEATRERMTVELGRTPTQSEVFARTHTRKEDRSWVDKQSENVNDVFLTELKRLQEKHQAIIDAGGPEGHPRSMRTLCGHGLRAAARGGGFMGWVWEIAQQAEAHAQSLAAVEAVCAEKVRTLESTVQTQSQEVSELRKAYSDMYSFLTQMRSSGSSLTAMPDMPTPPPPPPP